jgi:hypothetical protein
MFSTIFEERDKRITYLIKLGDCLGRSLRENVSLFAINGDEEEVTYLTESNKLISGKFHIGKDVSLTDISIEDSSVFEDDEAFDGVISQKIHTFVENVHYGEYNSADSSFDTILSLWEDRLKLSNLQKKLYEKSEQLAEIETILESEEIQNVIEVAPQIQEFLEENFDKISTVPEIKNAVNLSNSVSKAFNFPRLDYDTLLENGGYILKDGVSESIYEMICRQELVKKELLESKKDFESIWATNPNIQRLSGMMFESDEAIVTALAESLKEVPFLAMASKKTLTETFSNCLSNTDGVGITDKDIQEYASKIFEIKKEVKQMYIDSLNEKYGVNIQNLQEPATFKSLINTQIIIFESLSRLAPKGSVIKQVLAEAAGSLKGKSGVESIDLNEIIYELFHSAGYGDLIEEASAAKSPKINLKRVATDLDNAQNIIATLKEKVGAQLSSDETTEDEMPAAPEEAAAPEPSPEEEVPPMPEEPAPEEAAAGEEGAPAPGGEEDAINDLNQLEAMVSDLMAELGTDETKAEE